MLNISYLILILSMMFIFLIKVKNLMFFSFSFPFFESLCLIDWISLLFMSVLMLMSGSVLLFNKIYMKNDMFFIRFTKILILFIISMIILILFPFSMFFFLGWDGLGILSFLLVKYYNAWTSWTASFKTYIINRLGDGFFILLFASLLLLKNLWLKEFVYMKISLIFMFGCFTKSAQIPFSTWLPAAMAAPTPVSSLVHSSTLVTAGVYMLFRFWKFYSSSMKQLLLLISLLTALFASLAASLEWDSKKMVAFSTLSNLGMMMISLGLGLFFQGFFHLMTHAMAKANLFINVGYLMIKNNHHQDTRILSKKVLKTFLSSIFSIYSIFSLSGIMFFSGFFSKEKIIENTFLLKNFCLIVTFYLIILFSLIYGFRLMFLFKFNNNKFKIFKSYNKMKILSIFILTLFSIFFGFFLKNYFLKATISVSFLKIMYYSFIFFSLIFCFKIYKNWTISEFFFIKFLKSSFFINSFSEFGSFLFYKFDFGIFYKMEAKMYFFIKKIFFLLKSFFMEKIQFFLVFSIFIFLMI